MKKLIIIIAVLTLSQPAFADFNWGKGTYENYDDILIINSLGDKVAPSTFGKLGVNDFIEENAVKNYLALDGYTQANDYNPSITNPQFVDYYNDKPDGNYTKITFAGLQGDPRALQDVYVLTSEYERLSAQEQATRMDGIDTVNTTQTININNNATRIETVNSNSITRDNNLQNNINSVDTKQTIWNQNRDNTLIDHDKRINDVNKRVDDLNNRVSDLEQTQSIIGFEGRIYDGKKWQINTFVDGNITRNTVDRVGIKFQYKFGKSYEEKRIEELEKRLNNLERR